MDQTQKAPPLAARRAVKQRRRGFTLLEAVFTVAIIGIPPQRPYPATPITWRASACAMLMAELLELDLRRAREASVNAEHSTYVSFQSGRDWCWGTSHQQPCNCATGTPRCGWAASSAVSTRAPCCRPAKRPPSKAGWAKPWAGPRSACPTTANHQIFIDLNRSATRAVWPRRTAPVRLQVTQTCMFMISVGRDQAVAHLQCGLEADLGLLHRLDHRASRRDGGVVQLHFALQARGFVLLRADARSACVMASPKLGAFTSGLRRDRLSRGGVRPARATASAKLKGAIGLAWGDSLARRNAAKVRDGAPLSACSAHSAGGPLQNNLRQPGPNFRWTPPSRPQHRDRHGHAHASRHGFAHGACRSSTELPGFAGRLTLLP